MRLNKPVARLCVLLFVGALWVPLLYGFTINGAAPGSSASMTAVAVGTATPVAVATCANAAITGRTAIEFYNISASANCYGAPAPASSPCAAASPAPNAGNKAGEWLGPNSKWTFSFTGPGSQWGGLPQIQAEWDWVCDAASSIGHTDLP
jgi:hypothetical protein